MLRICANDISYNCRTNAHALILDRYAKVANIYARIGRLASNKINEITIRLKFKATDKVVSFILAINHQRVIHQGKQRDQFARVWDISTINSEVSILHAVRKLNAEKVVKLINPARKFG